MPNENNAYNKANVMQFNRFLRFTSIGACHAAEGILKQPTQNLPRTVRHLNFISMNSAWPQKWHGRQFEFRSEKDARAVLRYLKTFRFRT